MAVLTKITSRSLADNAVSSAKIQDGAIAVADVADGSISTAKLADDAVTQAKIGAGAVGNTEVNNSAGIVSTKLAEIPNSKLADDPLSGTNAKALGAGASFSAEQQELHGTTFTASGTGATVTGDLKLKSLVDNELTISGTGTITGSGGRILGEGDDKSEYVTKDGGGFTGSIQAPYINAGCADIGKFSTSDITIGGGTLTGTLSGGTGHSRGTIDESVKFPAGHTLQIQQNVYTTAWTQAVNTSNERREYIHNGTDYVHVKIKPKFDDSLILVKIHIGSMACHNTGTGWGGAILFTRTVLDESSTPMYADWGGTRTTEIGQSTSSNKPNMTFAVHTNSPTYDAEARTFEVLDEPKTNKPLMYRFAFGTHGSGSTYTYAFNRNGQSVGTNENNMYQATTTTNVMAQEIAG